MLLELQGRRRTGNSNAALIAAQLVRH